MNDKAAAREFKLKQLEAMRAKREREASPIVKTAKPEKPVKANNKPSLAKPVNHPISKRIEPDKPETCAYCGGTGTHEGLFKTDLCASCNGCGLDISNPLKVIEYQAAELKKQRKVYNDLGKRYSDLMNRYGVERYRDEELLKAVRGKDLKGRLD